MKRSPGNQHGFTLIEALVAIVVISIGLLGLLALQTFAISSTQSSQYRTLASIGVADIAARIAANPAGANDHDYDTIASPAQPQTTCRDQTCSPAQIAAVDAWQWDQNLATSLPNGRGFVDCSQYSVPGNQTSPCAIYVVTVAWNLRDFGQSTPTDTNQNLPPDTSTLCPDKRHGITGDCIVAEVGP